MARPRRRKPAPKTAEPGEELSAPMLEYRGRLQQMSEGMQKAYDTTIVTLAGAGLGFSMNFYKDFAGTQPLHANLLFWSWLCWGVSILLVLASYYTSIHSLSKAVENVDSNEADKGGGRFDRITGCFNFCAGLILMGGIVLFTLFAFFNLKS